MDRKAQPDPQARHASEDEANKINGIDNLRAKTKDDHIIEEKDGHYYICIDNDLDVNWGTSPACEAKMEEHYKEGERGFILNRMAVLRTYPAEHLHDAQRIAYLTMIGEGLARGFNCQDKAAMAMFDHAEEYAATLCRQKARCWYLCSSYISASIFATFILLGWLGKKYWDCLLGATAGMLTFGACFGALGALLSIMQRVGSTPLDPRLGRSLHYKEAANRIFVGVMAALVAELAIKVGLIMPFLAEKGLSAFVLVSIIAGISERLLPSIIGRVEAAAASEKKEAPESDKTTSAAPPTSPQNATGHKNAAP